MTLVKRGLLFGGAAMVVWGAAWALRERSQPAACPYGQRLFLDLPRPFMRRQRLRDLLAPASGERILEVGPGTGYYTLAIAGAVGPDGRVDALDLQQPMLDDLMRRAERRELASIAAIHGDAQHLPYSDASFDAAFLVATLGEIPDRERALAELRRVLKPGGRLVVGEGQPDPHMVPLADLTRRAEAVGFRFEEQVGNPFGYLARFRTPLANLP